MVVVTMPFTHSVDYEHQFGNYVIKVIDTPRIKDAVDFYWKSFLKDEPSTVAFGGYSTRHPAMIAQVEEVISDGVSVIAIDPENDNKMIGFGLAHTVTRENVPAKLNYEDYAKTFPATHACIMDLFDDLMWPGDIFERYPGDSKIFDIFAVATHQNYRGKGLAKKLVEQSLEVARMVKCDSTIVLATNDITRHIFQKMGMETLKTKKWSDCQVEGKSILGDVKSKMASAHYMKL